MATIDTLRNDLIDKLLTISNKEYLVALNKLVESTPLNDGIVDLTDEQVIMLRLSDLDIKSGKLISQAQLDKDDLEWLKEQ